MKTTEHGQRYFIIKDMNDANEVNTFCQFLDERGIDYDTEWEDVGGEQCVAVLIDISW